jgi:small conductance mechanosensitive channel
LGAQTLVRDLIGGLFILAEDQFHVGDNVRIGTATGVVERITLRATYLRDLDGALHLIPNGEIRAVANLSRGWSQAVVDVIIPADRPVAAALAVLESVCEAAAVDPELAPLLDGPPRVAGVEAVEAAGVRLRILARTGPGQQWQAARILRARALPALLGAALEVAAVLPADRPAPPTSDAGER